MIEIIPNWHPIVVHFSVGLLITAAIFHTVVLFAGDSSLKRSLTTLANWNLWIGAGFAVLTVIAGWFAFNSVTHDTPSHLVMLTHRKWAVATTILFVALALWSGMRAKKTQAIGISLALPVVVAAGLLLATAWYGGELVYRHGLGVMSLPSQSDHSHADGVAHDHGSAGHSDAGHSDAGHSHGDVTDGGHSHNAGSDNHHNSTQDHHDAGTHSHDDAQQSHKHQSID